MLGEINKLVGKEYLVTTAQAPNLPFNRSKVLEEQEVLTNNVITSVDNSFANNWVISLKAHD